VFNVFFYFANVDEQFHRLKYAAKRNYRVTRYVVNDFDFKYKPVIYSNQQ